MILLKKPLMLALTLLLAACGSSPAHTGSNYNHHSNGNLVASLKSAEKNADGPGRSVLKTGRVMTVDRQEIVRGSCWDYSNEVYNRAGYPNTRKNRATVFKGTKKRGPYAKASQIKPGDWLYFINHSYNGVEHSSIFVKWTNYKQRIGLMLSYGGEKRNQPARYREYDLSNVYQIIRPVN